jgi:hypothetical protein
VTQNPDQLRFTVSISQDRDGFLRQTCPSCGRDFKIQIDPAHLQWLLSSYCQRAGLEIGAASQQEDVDSHFMWCPYCSHRDQGNQMVTEETMAYLKRIVYREYVLPKINQLFSGLEDSFKGSNRSGGFLSIKVTNSKPVLPVRPIHGPEPPDFKIVTFLCCNKKIKISEHFNDVPVCSFCGSRVMLV